MIFIMWTECGQNVSHILCVPHSSTYLQVWIPLAAKETCFVSRCSAKTLSIKKANDAFHYPRKSEFLSSRLATSSETPQCWDVRSESQRNLHNPEFNWIWLRPWSTMSENCTLHCSIAIWSDFSVIKKSQVCLCIYVATCNDATMIVDVSILIFWLTTGTLFSVTL